MRLALGGKVDIHDAPQAKIKPSRSERLCMPSETSAREFERNPKASSAMTKPTLREIPTLKARERKRPGGCVQARQGPLESSLSMTFSESRRANRGPFPVNYQPFRSLRVIAEHQVRIIRSHGTRYFNPGGPHLRRLRIPLCFFLFPALFYQLLDPLPTLVADFFDGRAPLVLGRWFVRAFYLMLMIRLRASLN
jgi:hypothetical protein